MAIKMQYVATIGLSIKPVAASTYAIAVSIVHAASKAVIVCS